VIPRWIAALGLFTWALAGCAACTPHAAEEPSGPSPGAARLLIEEADLGPQAQKLLENLKSDPFVYFRFINRPWARATCEELGAELAAVPHVHLHGDAHVGQYAYTLTDHGLDDLDDSINGPAAVDIVRYGCGGGVRHWRCFDARFGADSANSGFLSSEIYLHK